MKVFLSYQRGADYAAAVSNLRSRLESELQLIVGDVRVFQDSQHLEEGQHFPEELDRELDRADILLIVLTPSWLRSRWCRQEFERFTRSMRDPRRLHSVLYLTWVSTKEVSAESSDNIARILAGIQSTLDWRAMRHKDVSLFGEAVARLAEALVALQAGNATRPQGMRQVTTSRAMAGVSLPRVDDHPGLVEVIVCRAQLRGFDFVSDGFNSRLADALPMLYGSVERALESALQNLSPALAARSGDFIPSLVRGTGLGTTLVWEVHRYLELRSIALLRRFVIDFIAYLQYYFDGSMKRAARDNVAGRPAIGLATSLVRESALRLKSPRGMELDYVGTAISIAGNLLRAAASDEVLAQLKFDSDLLMERLCLGEGALKRLPMSNVDFPVWTSIACPSDLARRRVAWRRPRTDDLAGAMAVLEAPTSPSPIEGTAPQLPLDESDSLTIFDLRARLEAQFTAETALRVRAGEIARDSNEIKMLAGVLERMRALIPKHGAQQDGERSKQWKELGLQFHMAVARLSTPIASLAELRAGFTKLIYERTRGIYVEATTGPGFGLENVAEEHERILELIVSGDGAAVEPYMSAHISSHYDRARNYHLEMSSLLPRPLDSAAIAENSASIQDHVVRSLDCVPERGWSDALRQVWYAERAKVIAAKAETVFRRLTSRRWPVDVLGSFIAGWAAMHHTAMFVAGLLVRIQREAKNREDPARLFLLAAADEVGAIIREDTGIDGPAHAELFANFADCLIGGQQWKSFEAGMPACRRFRDYVRRQRLSNSIEEGILTTLASELWNSGEYTFVQPLMSPWLRDAQGVPPEEIARATEYVDVHAGEAERAHFLHILIAWDYYCRADRRLPREVTLAESMDSYLAMLMPALEELDSLFDATEAAESGRP